MIEEQGHKGDQTGAQKYAKHCFANPKKPEVCVVLALSVLLFVRGTGPGTHQLFVGKDSKGRFSMNLMNTVYNLNDAEQVKLGCKPGDVGSHSARKGGGTFAMGQIAGPNPVTVTLRMNHSLGKLKDQYIFVCEGGDQLTGRMVSLLDFNSTEFTILPPHFKREADDILTTTIRRSLIVIKNNKILSIVMCVNELILMLLG